MVDLGRKGNMVTGKGKTRETLGPEEDAVEGGFRGSC